MELVLLIHPCFAELCSHWLYITTCFSSFLLANGAVCRSVNHQQSCNDYSYVHLCENSYSFTHRETVKIAGL